MGGEGVSRWQSHHLNVCEQLGPGVFARVPSTGPDEGLSTPPVLSAKAPDAIILGHHLKCKLCCPSLLPKQLISSVISCF